MLSYRQTNFSTEVVMLDSLPDPQWNSVCSLFAELIGTETYASGFQTMQLKMLSHDVAEVSVAHHTIALRLRSFYFDTLCECVFAAYQDVQEVRVTVRETLAKPMQQKPKVTENTTPRHTPPAVYVQVPEAFTTSDWHAWIASLGVTVDRKIKIERIIEETCRYFRIPVREFYETTKSRRRDEVFLRQIMMYLANKHSRLPMPRIARELGKKDHTTVMHGVGRITRLLSENSNVRANVETIEKALCT